MSNRTNRRRFLQTSALAGAGFWVAGRAAAESKSPNAKLNIGVAGVAGRGGGNLGEVSSENIVALCDVDDRHLAAAAKRFPQAKTYSDWRKMMEQKDLDAVVCSTTEHTHPLICAWALRRKLHVYCEKPIAPPRISSTTRRKLSPAWIWVPCCVATLSLTLRYSWRTICASWGVWAIGFSQ